MRKRTTSACAVLAWTILTILVAAGLTSPARTAQANHRTASSTTITQVTLTTYNTPAGRPATPARAAPARYTVQPGDTLSGIATALAVPGGWQALYAANRAALGPDPNAIHPGTILALPGPPRAARYLVAPGDTLTGIAAALGIRGGWQALYTANRRAIGADPNLLRVGLVLTAPHPASRPAPRAHPAPRARIRPAPRPARPGQPGGERGRPTVQPVNGTASGLPQWLKVMLLAAGAAIAFALIVALAMVTGRRRWREARRRRVVEKARVILADHDRLIVTYSVQDDTVYVLTPPGEDPRAVLRAARLVVPEDKYGQLADHLGVPASWPME